MTTTPAERTVLPGGAEDRLAELLAALETSRRPALVAADGSRVELPDELFDVLHDVATALSRGLAITVAPRHTVLGTGEAARLLGVSRPTLVRMLESGAIPYSRPGRHRRIRLDDLLAHQARSRRARAGGLDEMVRAAEDAGVYDLPDDAVVERRDTG